MSDQVEFKALIRFQLSKLKTENKHHDFEHLCRYFSKLRICDNILPATGPVSAGGDRGRDFETFTSYRKSELLVNSAFVGETQDRVIIFGCSLTAGNEINSKIKSDCTTICNGGSKPDEIIYFCEADIQVSNRLKIIDWAKKNLNIDLQVFDGNALAEQLCHPDLYWISERFLDVSSEHFPKCGHLEDEKYFRNLIFDKIRKYKEKMENRLASICEQFNISYYIDRKLSYRIRESWDTNIDGKSLSLRASMDATSRDVQYDKLAERRRGINKIEEILEMENRALVIGQSGMGKSIEAAKLAVRFTKIDSEDELSCCVVIDCKNVISGDTHFKDTFDRNRNTDLNFDSFRSMSGWKRYLVLEGFDEVHFELYDHFVKLMKKFIEENPEIKVFITSRQVYEVNIHLKDWETYQLQELEKEEVINYVRRSLEKSGRILNRAINNEFEKKNWTSAIRLLQIPFFLNAFVLTARIGDGIDSIGRYPLVSRYVDVQFEREFLKSKSLELRDIEKMKDNITKTLFKFAYSILVNSQEVIKFTELEEEVIKDLRKRCLFIETKVNKFITEEVGNYFASKYIFENLYSLNSVENMPDEKRYKINGWILENINYSNNDYGKYGDILDWLWKNDPILVSFCLFDETFFKALKIQEIPWGIFEVGLIKIMLGENPESIPERKEICEIRLASPEEKLLRRLWDLDLPHLIYAVPNRRSPSRLENAWEKAPEAWCEFLKALPFLAHDWIRDYVSKKWPDVPLMGSVILCAYGIDKLENDYDKACRIAQAACDNIYSEVEILVNLIFVLRKFNFTNKKYKYKNINKYISKIYGKIFSDSCRLTPKQIHRLIVDEIINFENGGISKHSISSKKIKNMIYSNDGTNGGVGSVINPSLLGEIPELNGLNNDVLSKSLWRLISEDVAKVPPITLAGVLRNKIVEIDIQWRNRWEEAWLGKLTVFEAIFLMRQGFSFSEIPPSLEECNGWMQARDAAWLSTLKGPNYIKFTNEQKKYWVASSTEHDLLNLLRYRLIIRGDSDSIFESAVKKVIDFFPERRWWDLVRYKILGASDISEKVAKLRARVALDPEAFELLSSGHIYDGNPSQEVVDRVTKGPCGVEIRFRIFNSRIQTIQRELFIKCEVDILNNILGDIGRDHNAYISSVNNKLLKKFFILRYRSGEGGEFKFVHPGIKDAIYMPNIERIQISAGRLICGSLKVERDSAQLKFYIDEIYKISDYTYNEKKKVYSYKPYENK